VDIGDSLNVLENSLRDLVELVLKKVHGEGWFDHLGVTDQRKQEWQERREAEPKRRPGGEVEQRLLYYAQLYDVVLIIQKNWDSGFGDCFRNRKRFDVYLDRLSAFRDPNAHSRTLLPFEGHLVLGMTGELRQEIAIFLGGGGGGLEPEHFPRIEEVRDSYGMRVVGAASGGTSGHSQVVLRPGDTISFAARAWDPGGIPFKWRIFLAARREFVFLDGSEIEWEWQIEERDISEKSYLTFTIISSRTYHRTLDANDDSASLFYRVLPQRR